MTQDRVYLLHIQECIDRIEQYTKAGRNMFEATPLIQDGVVRNLEVIGEATKRLSRDLRSLYPHIPWRQIAGLRDVLIHDYMGINLVEVWNVVMQDIPSLKHAIREILNDTKFG
jgi:uncharacterized protein with HEPN domain